ncbi:hypothetical protein CONLIGDRAFT_647030 [Coniochaeta ligniaria NRRL 30616]|uniref:Zn(2)-C6 fungal-type domain-containing protein n=1 Tax=Coniochaeta ligniaria NRRL 30616 TaxID=1408157 RepID=A0A1J7JGZ3_9PEZI|nr:hypothetical protein CONLIGDRAFT_647030 [Coniochaeta ligniaria NRRL 30616]
MAKTRITRSKAGCQSCRRRKVRCDEKKPICAACSRLELACSYEPGAAPSASPGASRYRVRFVTSSGHGRRSSGGTSAPASGTVSRTRSAQSSQQDMDREASESNVEAESAQGSDDRSESTVLHPNPDLTLNPGPGESPSLPSIAVPDEQEGLAVGSMAPAPQMMGDVYNLHAGALPLFFDLNMNFDVAGEEWLTFPQTPVVEATVSDSVPTPAYLSEPTDCGSPQQSAVVIGGDDHGLIQHYLNVMTQYTKVRGPGDENIYTQIFSNMALFYKPLFEAIMSWTGLHLGHARREPALIQKAEQRYLHAVSLIHLDQDVAHHFELSLVTIWFALQFELLAARGIDTFCQHLQFTADLVDAHRLHQKAGGQAIPLGPIGVRVLIWLGTYDARASWVGRAGRLLQNLELYCADHDFLEAAFPDTPSGSRSTELLPFLRLTLELDTVEARIVQLNRRPVTPPAAIWAAAQSNLMSIQERLESNATVAPILSWMLGSSRSSITTKITTACFNYLLLLAACYSLIISFHRMLPAPAAALGLPDKLLSAEAASARIVRISSWVCKLRPPSPQNIWPSILFRVGIETTDLVHQEWAIKQFADAELWGANFGKTRVLLEQVIKRQSHEGARVDFLDVMRQTTGLFII